MFRKSILQTLFCFLITINSFSQAIYSGGDDDGFSKDCYTQLSNLSLEIYSGGTDDGSSSNCYTQLNNTSLEIYGGGTDDGSSSDCYTQLSNTSLEIYGGGMDDGASSDCYEQLNNTSLEIYGGGTNDGFSNDCYTQLNNTSLEIYGGGTNDGHSIDCYLQSDPPLPISLLYFTAIDSLESVLLKWQTSSEKNNKYFTVEKTIDIINFSDVISIDGAGNSNKIISYTTIDNNPYRGTSYYRLKQTDYDGNHHYSPLVKVEFGLTGEFSMNVFPNPGRGEDMTLTLYGDKGREVLVMLYDIYGREHFSKVYLLEENGNFITALDPSEKITSGVYIITATSNQNIISKKLIVK